MPAALFNTSLTDRQVSRWYWIHWNSLRAGRPSAGGYSTRALSSSMTRPASFIPPRGNSRPNWLKVTLPNFEVQRRGTGEPAAERFLDNVFFVDAEEAFPDRPVEVLGKKESSRRRA